MCVYVRIYNVHIYICGWFNNFSSGGVVRERKNGRGMDPLCSIVRTYVHVCARVCVIDNPHIPGPPTLR